MMAHEDDGVSRIQHFLTDMETIKDVDTDFLYRSIFAAIGDGSLSFGQRVEVRSQLMELWDRATKAEVARIVIADDMGGIHAWGPPGKDIWVPEGHKLYSVREM